MNQSAIQDRNEKQFVLQLFERENKRAKLLEARAKPKQAQNAEKPEEFDPQTDRVDKEYDELFM